MAVNIVRRRYMSDGVTWLPESFSEGFCVAFCEGVSLEDFILRLGGNIDRSLMLTREQVEAIDLASRYPEMNELESYDLNEDELRDTAFMHPDAEIIRMGCISGWAYAIQSFGSYLSSPVTARQASRDTRYISFGQTVNMAAWVQYAVDGELVNSFDPLHPVGGSSEGIRVEGLEDSHDPAFSVLTQMEERFHLEIPRSTDIQPMMTVCVGR
ncbi:DUF6461 domain-containing protein [Streptomyces sp. NPDC000983]|uniref:DUF6461 domain-containing protein n=1 Tax=Streptomyces sp. NPDC000983 TaxID=3154373 RepID=UPI00332F9262